MRSFLIFLTLYVVYVCLVLWAIGEGLFGVNGSLPHYSLIVTDTHNYQWVVDYNLTQSDCQAQLRASAICAIQPQGELP